MSFLKKHIIKIILLLIVVVGGVYGYYYYTQSQTAAQPQKLETVTKGDLLKTISATGSLSAVDNVDINSKITGRIVEVYVKENQHVEAGQQLLCLDDTTLAATVKQNAAKLQNALVTYNRDLTLLRQGALAQSDFDTAEADYIVAQANYDTAVANLSDTIITSPIAGYIIGEPTPVGQTVSSGISTPQVLMSVANLDKMQIDVLVDESDIGQVRDGQMVSFTVDAYTDQNFEGQVRLVSRSATTTNNVIYYTVYVDVDNKENKLLPTMTARADIIISEVKAVLSVPVSCINTDDQGKYVQVYDEKTKVTKKVYVETGLTNDERTEITGELNEGDKVIPRTVKATTTTSTRVGGGPGGPPL